MTEMPLLKKTNITFLYYCYQNKLCRHFFEKQCPEGITPSLCGVSLVFEFYIINLWLCNTDINVWPRQYRLFRFVTREDNFQNFEIYLQFFVTNRKSLFCLCQGISTPNDETCSSSYSLAPEIDNSHNATELKSVVKNPWNPDTSIGFINLAARFIPP